MIVAFGSRKASPGVTTLTSMLAAYWSELDVLRLIVEADPSGGTIAARWCAAHDLSWDPGLVAMSAHRGRLGAAALQTTSQPLATGLRVAAAPPSPQQVTAALVSMGEKAAASLAGAPEVRAFVDCGRLTAGSAAMPIARRAALTVLLCRPTLEEIHTLMPGVTELRDAGCTLGLLVVGDGPYHPTEIADKAGIELLGHLPNDPRAAADWDNDGLNAGRHVRRSLLARTVSDLGVLIAARCAHVMVPDALLTETAQVTTIPAPPSPPTSEPVGFAALLADHTADDLAHLNGVSTNGVSHE
jgi:hypothetical protein